MTRAAVVTGAALVGWAVGWAVCRRLGGRPSSEGKLLALFFWAVAMGWALTSSGCSSEGDQTQVTCEDVRNAVAAVPPRGCDFGDASAWYPKQCLPGEGYKITDARKCVDLLNTATCAEISAGPQGTVCAMVPVGGDVDAGLDSSSKVQVDAQADAQAAQGADAQDADAQALDAHTLDAQVDAGCLDLASTWPTRCDCGCFSLCVDQDQAVCLPRCHSDTNCSGGTTCYHKFGGLEGVCL